MANESDPQVPDLTGAPVGYTFAVGDDVMCFWDPDHLGRNREYLNGIEVGYYEALARSLASMLDSGDRRAASIALRGAYHQAVETLMSFLGAMSQAPHCVAGWVAQCSTNQLKLVVERLAAGHTLLTQEGNHRTNFEDLAPRSLPCAWGAEREPGSTANRFAVFWRRLASDFLDDRCRAGYNAMKHGMRVSPGGAFLSIGPEDTPGVPALAEAMRSMGGSEFGSTFFQREQLDAASKLHFFTRRTTINWSAPTLALRLGLIAMSISNIVAALLIESGIAPEEKAFHRPTPPDLFDRAWDLDVGVTHIAIDNIIVVPSNQLLTKEQLRAHLESRRPASR